MITHIANNGINFGISVGPKHSLSVNYDVYNEK